MTGTYKVGAGSSGGAYVKYLLSKAIEAGHKLDAAARYYAGQAVEPATLSPIDELGKALHAGDVSYSEALAELIRTEIALLPTGADLDIDAMEERLSAKLEAAATRADFAEAGMSLGESAKLRPDLDPAFARRLGISADRPLTVGEMANLMDNKTASGAAIEGKKKHSAHRSVAETFGLDLKAWPSVEAVQNVLAGKRVDGTQPVAANGTNPIPARVVDSSVRKFKSAIGIPASRDATDEDVRRVADGRIDGHEYRKQIAATAPPIGYVDIVWSADKSVSVAFAVAPTEAESEIIRTIVEHATADAMAYLEGRLGVARRGAGGKGLAEPAKLAWVATQHLDARPTVDVVRYDAQNRPYSEERDVPGQVDPNLHVHNVVLSSMMTESGQMAAINLDLLDGEIKVFGAVGHAALATHARTYGINVAIGPHGEARFTDVSEGLRTFYSRRTTEGTEAAKAYAAEQGKDWDSLKPAEQVALLNGGVANLRRDKDTPDVDRPDDRVTWQADAARAGFRPRSVLRPDEIEPELSPEQRIEVARDAALPLLDKAFQRQSVLSLGEVREIAARGLIASGIGSDAAADIEAVTTTFKVRGITVNGEVTEIMEARVMGKDGRPQTNFTSGRAVEQEETLMGMVRLAAADKSTALTTEQIDHAADHFLATHRYIDPAGAQWLAQRQMAHAIGTGGRVSLSIGVAGSGKTSGVISALTEAWHEDGRVVYGMTVPWKSSDALRDAGVDHAVAIDAFLRRVEKGQYKVDSKSVIVADEVSQLGVRHQTALLNLVTKTGAQLVEIGDPRQCQAVETPAIDLMAKAIGDEAIPKLLTTIRQKTTRDREVATMFRDGQAADGIAALQEDKRFHLVAGSQATVIEHTTNLWRKLTDANAATLDYSLLVMVPTNAQARQVGLAIRQDLRKAGALGTEETTLKAMDPNSGETFDLAVSTGDRLRLFTRAYDADEGGRKKVLASNGDVVEVTAVLESGLRVRTAEGTEGRITWSQMKPWRAPKNDPVRLTYGFASTIDTAQSRTVTDSILVFPDGTAQATGFKSYTGTSRHTNEAHMVISDAAERRAIVKRQMLGVNEVPRQEDVVRNIANNLSRFGKREQATDMLARAYEVSRGTIQSFYRGSEAVERNAKIKNIVDRTDVERSRIASSVQHSMEQVLQRQQMQHAVQRNASQIDRDQGLGLER